MRHPEGLDFAEGLKILETSSLKGSFNAFLTNENLMDGHLNSEQRL